MGKADTLANILRVNHAGEYGAIRIYQAQLCIARWRSPSLAAELDEILAHEKSHRASFENLMRERHISHCGALPLWGLGGWSLGAFTGLLGRNATLTCTAAVERVVHRHLDEQLGWLGEADPEVSVAISAVRDEEAEHLGWAENTARARRGPLYGLVSLATEALIWLSTYGASGRLQNAVRPHTPP